MADRNRDAVFAAIPYIVAVIAGAVLSGPAPFGRYAIRLALVLAAVLATKSKISGRLRPSQILAGIFIAMLWILSIRVFSAPDLVYDPRRLSAATRWIWIAVRSLGAIAILPLAEELFFRRSALAALRDWGYSEGVALALSSLAFGFSHSPPFWCAGAIAGFAFGKIYLRDGLRGAWLAHAAANLALTIFVLSTGHWELW